MWTDFNRWVLEPIRKEFESADVAFPVKFNQVKTGKKVTGIEFIIPREERRARKALAAAAAAPVAGAPAAAADRFAEWLAGHAPDLQKAYAGLVSTSNRSQGANHLSPAVARKIVEYVAGQPELEATLYSARHRIATTTEPVKDKAGYFYAQLVKSLGREFKP